MVAGEIRAWSQCRRTRIALTAISEDRAQSLTITTISL
jgi:uncharacterized protein YjiS (DUF1127 family)